MTCEYAAEALSSGNNPKMLSRVRTISHTHSGRGGDLTREEVCPDNLHQEKCEEPKANPAHKATFALARNG